MDSIKYLLRASYDDIPYTLIYFSWDYYISQ